MGKENWTNFKKAYLSQFSTYRYKTPLFGIVRSRCLSQGVKCCSSPTQSRDIEQNVKKVRITFTFCLISLYWVGRFTPCKKHLLLTILKSGVSYLYVENWLRYAFLKLFQFSLPILYLAFWVFTSKYFCCMMKKL